MAVQSRNQRNNLYCFNLQPCRVQPNALRRIAFPSGYEIVLVNVVCYRIDEIRGPGFIRCGFHRFPAPMRNQKAYVP